MTADNNVINTTEFGNRFDYVAYDQESTAVQAEIKKAFVEIEQTITQQIKSPRARALVLTKLEEAYMWVGKAIRDDQNVRTGRVNVTETRSAS